MTTAESYGFIKPTGSDYIKDGDDAISTNADVTARLVTFMEGLAAEPGSRLENFVYDPAPAGATDSYGGGNVAIVQAPGWGRAMATAAAATSVFAYVNTTGSTTDRRRISVQAGQPVAARVELRAMPTQKMSATVNIIGWKADGTSSTLFTTDQLDMEADAARVFQVAGTIPENSGVQYVELRWTFRRFGETYPSINDYVFFRRALLTAGPNTPTSTPVEYFDGNTSGAYWSGTPNLSSSVILKPRGGGNGANNAAGAAHAALVDEWSHRMGGRWHCGKTTTVSIRVDHGLANFWSKFKPILDGHGIPATIALGADTWGISENSGVTASMVNAAVATGRYAIAAHGWGNHLDTADPALIRKYIVDAKAKLEADIPAAAPIDIFMPPGASGNGSWGGFLPSTTPAKYSETLAGQLALATYPICSGQFSGTTYRVQDGHPRIGQSYFNMDTFTDSQVLSRVNTAISDGRGIQLMIHPSLIDSGPGYITTAQLTSLFTTLKAMHDDGTIRFVSVAQQYLADSSTPYKVSQTAGRTVSVWDYLNNREQLIYGDTGWRSLTVPNVAPLDGSGTIKIRRVNDRISLQFDGVGYTGTGISEYLTAAGFIPAGFQPGYGDNPAATVGNVNANKMSILGILQSTRIRLLNSVSGWPGVGVDALRGQLTWTTTQTWPTTLPGVAA